MTSDQKILVNDSVRFGCAGLYLLAVVFFAPHAGYQQGASFFQVARHSAWSNLFDWPAAWCSVEIILLGCGGLLLLISLGALWFCWMKPRFMGWLLLLLAAAPFVDFWVGLYYLVKAIF